MTILLYKNGQWFIDGEQPLEGVSLDNLAAILSNPKDGDVVKYDEASGMWIVGEAGTYSKPSGGIPESDLAPAVQDKLNKFIVTLTPTSPDFSGTMDKTANEITAAYEAGQEIVFNVVGFPGFDHVYIPAAWCSYATDNPNCAACATLVDGNNDLQIIIVTSDVDGSTTYSTDIYSLTPAS